MVRRYIQVAFVALLYLGDATAQPVVPADSVQTIYLVRFGWHADVVVPIGACKPLPDEAPERLLGAARVAVGWGDARYFPTQDPDIVALLRAALVPSASVLMVRAVNTPVERIFGAYDVLAFEVTRADCERLGAFIRSHFVIEEGSLFVVPTDRQTSAVFFLSTDEYHLLNNCNHWTAEALRTAGLDVRPALVPTVALLWRAVADQGELVSTAEAASP